VLAIVKRPISWPSVEQSRAVSTRSTIMSTETDLALVSPDMHGNTSHAAPRAEPIRYAIGQSSLGAVLVAASAKGVCAIILGDHRERLQHDLREAFPNAELSAGGADLDSVVAKVVEFIEAPAQGFDLPLDPRGTPFQQRVWRALREIPAGTTATYSEIAERVGAPKEAYAVGEACAANTIAVAIPCHRVVRKDGTLAGYRWGFKRKRALLAREHSASERR
jgi:AraC family transcriptional regulator, regulatory protein of adaptative response / methylated-DNA-[protein]-cysteine methyltransferase